MLFRLLAALLLCASALSANATVFRVDAIDAYVPTGNPRYWQGPGPTPTSLNISFLLNTGDANYTMIAGCPNDPVGCLGEFHSTMSARLLDVSTDSLVLAHNVSATGYFGGDSPIRYCVGCTRQELVADFQVTSPQLSFIVQFDSVHFLSWSQLLSSSDPTSLLIGTIHTHDPAFHFTAPWGEFWAGARNFHIAAVPEPSSCALLIAGLLITGYSARRKLHR